MNKVLAMHVCMVMVVALVCSSQGTVRLYYKGKPSKLSTKVVTPLVWTEHSVGATHYIDMPGTLLVGMYEHMGTHHGKHVTSYEVYKLKGSAGRYAKRACKEVM